MNFLVAVMNFTDSYYEGTRKSFRLSVTLALGLLGVSVFIYGVLTGAFSANLFSFLGMIATGIGLLFLGTGGIIKTYELSVAKRFWASGYSLIILGLLFNCAAVFYW